MKRLLVAAVFCLLSLCLSASLMLFTINPCHAYGIGFNTNGVYVLEAEETSPNTWDWTGNSWHGLGFTVPVEWGSNHAYFTTDTAGPSLGVPYVRKRAETFGDFNDDAIFLSSHVQEPSFVYSPTMTTWQEKVDWGYVGDGYSEIYPDEVRNFIITTDGGYFLDSGFFIRPEEGHYYTDDFHILMSVATFTPGNQFEVSVGGNIYFDVSPPPVPIPTTILLLGSGLIGIIGIRRKLKK